MANRFLKAGVAALGAAAFLIATAGSAFAQETGKMKMSVYPPEAYTFVDGRAIGPGNRTIKVEPGKHQVIVANYGFKFFQEDVSVAEGETTAVNAQLEPVGTPVPAGERGRIQLEVGTLDAGDAAVLLNGKSPHYFVGHVHEFNNNIINEQELIVPPGTHQVTVTRHNDILWSGDVTVQPNQRVIVTISNGKTKEKDWPRGLNVGSRPMDRFHAGMASATVVVAPVSGSISATPETIKCGESSQLKWASTDAVEADVSGLSPVPTSGERAVSPKKTTTYDFTANGPGGVHKSSATVTVSDTLKANLEASPAEVRYERIGDKVIHQGNATVNWSTSNADSVSLEPFGNVEASGSKSLPITPSQTATGPVDETVTYTLKASNACGNAETKTASIHVVGSIQGAPTMMLQSVFYPTAYPTKQNPTLGLLDSQQQVLANLASGFIKYLEYDPEAKLRVVAHADIRGNAEYNEQLANRRAELVKQVLMSNGIHEDRIEVMAVGKEQPISPDTIAELEAQNPNPMPEEWAKQHRINQLAYQRRVDIVLLPANKESVRFYPNAASDVQILRQQKAPPLSSVQSAVPNENH